MTRRQAQRRLEVEERTCAVPLEEPHPTEQVPHVPVSGIEFETAQVGLYRPVQIAGLVPLRAQSGPADSRTGIRRRSFDVEADRSPPGLGAHHRENREAGQHGDRNHLGRPAPEKTRRRAHGHEHFRPQQHRGGQCHVQIAIGKQVDHRDELQHREQHQAEPGHPQDPPSVAPNRHREPEGGENQGQSREPEARVENTRQRIGLHPIDEIEGEYDEPQVAPEQPGNDLRGRPRRSSEPRRRAALAGLGSEVCEEDRQPHRSHRAGLLATPRWR